ncbi:MAG: penicillin-insensitive murein endopeptidase [Pseudomonadota bacterium]
MARIWIAMALGLFLAGPVFAQPPAKQIFGAVAEPSEHDPAPYGSYARGCIAGAIALAETGPAWQAMRLSRNRNWGHPAVIAFIERLGLSAREIGWPGLYVGDISQPMGGPMRSGHRSHQIGLDVDIWMRRPGPEPLSRARREQIGSISVVAPSRRTVNASWTDEHGAVLRAAALDPTVARIFVNPAIKDRLCRDTAADDRAWLRKIRPWWGHDAHFHVRLNCPADAAGCQDQAPPPPGDGCDDSLAWWFSDEALNPKPSASGTARGPLRMEDLPAACRALVNR